MRSDNQRKIFLVLDNIRSAHNVGAIFRSADGAGINKLFLCGITATPPHDEIFKTALGTTESVEWEYWERTQDLIVELKGQGIKIIALEQTANSVNFKKFNYPEHIAIVVGNEPNGVSAEVLDLCDDAVDLPMAGKAKSLNVATATGILLYHLI